MIPGAVVTRDTAMTRGTDVILDTVVTGGTVMTQ